MKRHANRFRTWNKVGVRDQGSGNRDQGADEKIAGLVLELDELGARFNVDEIDGMKQGENEAP